MEQSECTFCEAVLKICHHYFDLFDAMKDWSSPKPQINSEELNEIIAEPLSSDDDDDSLIGNENVIQPNNQDDETLKAKTTAVPTARPATIKQLKLYQQPQLLTYYQLQHHWL